MQKKYKFVSQDDSKDCGVASLLMIIRTHGGNVPKEYLKCLTNTTTKGTSAYDLLQAGESLGFSTKGVNGNILDLDNHMLPCIAHVIINNSYQHFVVIYKINKKKNTVVIADPSKGIKEIKIEEFNNISTSKYFLFVPNKELPIIKLDNKLNNSVLQLFFRYKNILITILVFSLIYTLINILTSFNFQFIIEQALQYDSLNNLYAIIIGMLLLTFIKTVVDLLRNNLFNFINHELDYVLIKDIFSHIISLPYLYYKSKTTGDIISRINDLGEIKESLSRLFIAFFVDLILVVFVCISLFRINSNLTLMSFIIVLLYWIVIKVFKPSLNKLIKENRINSSHVNTYLMESISSADTIKELSVEENVKDRFNAKYNEFLNSNYKFNKVYNMENFFKEFINHLGMILLIGIGSSYVLDNKMSLAELITFNSLIMYFLEPIKNFINMDVIIHRSKIALDRINELYGINAEEKKKDEKSSNKNLKGNIFIKSLSYSYGIKEVLNDFDTSIEASNKVIIYGDSGCGKSTLAKILMKYFDVERGKVFIDDKDIVDYNVMDIRNKICYIAQNEHLFTDTIYNNIVLGRSVDYDYFLKICKLARVDEIVKDSIMSYNMLIEENGFNLSGGERQRIILARSLIEVKDVYILDECLSQLDIDREREILLELIDTYPDKTMLFISHRFDNKDLFDTEINMNRKEIYA